jgi:hypothetical protein
MKSIDRRESWTRMTSGSGQSKSKKLKSVSREGIISHMKLFGLAAMKYAYLIVGLIGLVSTVIIILKVINLPSITNLGMVFRFVIACLSLVVMRAGFNGFYQLNRGRND